MGNRGIVAVAVLSCAFAACSGGGGVTRLPSTAAPNAAVPNPTSSATATAQSGSKTATIAIRIPLPSASPQAADTAAKRRGYIGATTTAVTIDVAYPGQTIAPIKATKQCNSSNEDCVFVASASLAVEPDDYTFTIYDYGKGGTSDALSTATVTQKLVAGPNVIDVTLAPIVATMSFTIPGGPPVAGNGANQTFPLDYKAFDGDGSQITVTTPYAHSYTIGFTEVDDLGAFALTPGSGSKATCDAASDTCAISSNSDTINVLYIPQANGFSSDPGYYQEELIVYDLSAETLTSANSVDFISKPCITPDPICVYSPPLYAAEQASGKTVTTFSPFSPNVVAVNGDTIWTDVGVVAVASPAPTYKSYPSSDASLELGSIAYVSSKSNAFAPDYTATASNSTQTLAQITSAAAVTTTTYPTSTYTLDGTSSGAGIIVGPDGNLWWIDPVTGVLDYASPSSPTTVSSCVLQSKSNVFLTAAQIVATPSGVTPSRIWFSAVDSINTESYIGYVTVPSSGANSCGSGQSGHYSAFDTADEGTATPPNGIAVDGSGNLWYDEGDDITYAQTNIGEAEAKSGGSVSIQVSKAVPGALGASGGVNADWGIVYDPADGYLYFAADSGLIGRFLPADGVSSATAYDLPDSFADGAGDGLNDITGGPEGDDGSNTPCGDLYDVPGPCVNQFLWDAGNGGAGRLTFVVPGLNSTINGPLAVNVVAQLDLSNSGVSFTTQAHARHFSKHHHLRVKRTPKFRVRYRPAGTAVPSV